MAHEMFDVQAALLYGAVRRLDLEKLAQYLCDRAAEHPGLLPNLKAMPVSTEDFFLLAGDGLHVTLRFQDEPCAKGLFDTQLASPLKHLRRFDYGALIDAHQAAIIVNVGDGETLMSAENRQMMAGMTGQSGQDPLYKLATLHAVLQAVTKMARPIVVDFCPTMTLLRPEEYEGLADDALPIQMLFHPYPESRPAGPDGIERMDITAFRSDALIGKTLVLSDMPLGVSYEAVQKTLTLLIEGKFTGLLALDHGDVVRLTETGPLYVRHDADQIIASVLPPQPQSTASPEQESFKARLAGIEAKRAAEMSGVPRAPFSGDRSPPPLPAPPQLRPPLRLIGVGLLMALSLGFTWSLFPDGIRQSVHQSIQTDMMTNAGIQPMNQTEVDPLAGQSLTPKDPEKQTFWDRLNDASGDL